MQHSWISGLGNPKKIIIQINYVDKVNKNLYLLKKLLGIHFFNEMVGES